MRTAIFAALTLIISACGRGTTTESHIDPAFLPFITTFNSEAEAHGSSVRAASITIQFGSLAGSGNLSEEGVCDIGGGRTITIDPGNWKYLSEPEREELIFHELGHCVLNRQHNEEIVLDRTSGFIPASIMHSTLVGWGVYTSRRAAYLDELFL